MQGSWSLAKANISLMSLALSPIYLSTIALETTWMYIQAFIYPSQQISITKNKDYSFWRFKIKHQGKSKTFLKMSLMIEKNEYKRNVKL